MTQPKKTQENKSRNKIPDEKKLKKEQQPKIKIKAPGIFFEDPDILKELKCPWDHLNTLSYKEESHK